LQVALRAVMSSYDSIYKKMAESLEHGAPGFVHESAHKFDPARHISPAVAHELNNILTVIQGYADRLLMKHGEDPALQPHLKLISQASQRAATVIRAATPPISLRQNSSPLPQPA
jgi:nitrogen-specific signal transduction histidine kinase